MSITQFVRIARGPSKKELTKDRRGYKRREKWRHLYIFTWKGVLNEDRYIIVAESSQDEAQVYFNLWRKNRYDVGEYTINKVKRDIKGIVANSK